MRKPIPYGRQEITQGDIDAVIETLQSDFLTQGPKIQLFENEFAQYVDSKYAVAVSNGSEATIGFLDIQIQGRPLLGICGLLA